MSAISMHDLVCLPTADCCTRRDAGHYENLGQRTLLEAAPDAWRYGAVRRTNAGHVTTIDLDDAPSVAVWHHRHKGRIFLAPGTAVALHEPAGLMYVKKVLPVRISMLVLGPPHSVHLPAEWHHMRPAVRAAASPPPLLTTDELSVKFKELTRTHGVS